MIRIGSCSAEVPAGLTSERARRWALHRTLRDLRLSAARGRRISLPNLLRLYRRRTASLAIPESDLLQVRAIYLRDQPFQN